MNTRPQHPHQLLLLPLLLLAGLLFASGCSDLVNVEPDPRDPLAVESSKNTPPVNGRDVAAWAKEIQNRSKKARHYHLLDRAVLPAAAGKTTAAGGAFNLIMRVKGGAFEGGSTAEAVLKTLIDKHKIFNRFEFKTALHGLAVTVPAENLDAFVDEADTLDVVEWHEPDAAVPFGIGTTTTVPATTQQVPWGITSIGADVSSALSGDGTGTVDVDLYVLDSGAESPDLNVVECLDLIVPTGVEPCTTTDDPEGHGTGVAAVAAAKDDQAGIVGVAPGARVHVIKTLRENGNTPLGALVKVVDFLTKRKLEAPSVPMVVNISLGADVKTSKYNGLDEAVEASIAAGVVYVISAGNDGIDAAEVSPAHVAEAITVGAYAESGVFSWFSNYGSVVDLLAPGEEVLTLRPTGELGTTSGTSLSAPYVAGAAALLLSQQPTLSPQQVRDQLVGSAQATISGAPPPTTNKALFVTW